jgi:flagellar biosynthesis/type III secretory pathway M-ring protein FliF/YscJ
MNDLLKTSSVKAQALLAAVPGPILAIVGLVLVLLAAGIGFWHWAPVQAATVPLFTGRTFSSRELLAIEAALVAAELQDYTCTDGQIRVPAAQRSAYLKAIMGGNAIPAGFSGVMEQALADTRLFELGAQREQRFGHARDQQAASAVRAISGVEEAFVHFDESTPTGFRGQREITALVGVRAIGGRALREKTLVAIHRTVLGYKAGLQAENVTLIDLGAGWAFRGDPQQALPSGTAGYGALRDSLQQEWTERIRTMLGFIPSAQVAVHVQLTSRTGDQRGPPTNELSPSRVVVSVSVPASYLRQVWHHRSGTRRPSASDLSAIEDETRVKIESAVQPLLPEGQRDRSRISVNTFDDLQAPVGTAPWIAARAWIAAHWQLAALAGALLLLAISTRALLGRATAKTPGPAARQFQLVREEATRPDTAAAAASPDPASLRERLQTLVQQDPDAVAQQLEEWIKKAG